MKAKEINGWYYYDSKRRINWGLIGAVALAIILDAAIVAAITLIAC